MKKKLGKDPIAEVGAEIKALNDLKVTMGYDSYMPGFEIIETAQKKIIEYANINDERIDTVCELEQKIFNLNKEIAGLEGELATERLTKPLQLDFAGKKVTVADLLGTTEFSIETRKFGK